MLHRRHERFVAPMTMTEFLAWEERQELRYEFDGFEPVDMTGGTIRHHQITFDLRTALAARLMGKPCRPFGPNAKIIVDGHVRHPDVAVVCRPVCLAASIVEDPVIVFEVLSELTSKTGLIDKNREYRAPPSILRYVIPQQTHQAAIVFVRRNDGWLSEIVSDDDATLDLPEIGIAVPSREIYANAGLPDRHQKKTRRPDRGAGERPAVTRDPGHVRHIARFCRRPAPAVPSVLASTQFIMGDTIPITGGHGQDNWSLTRLISH
jgi:Uma2 family endonuclease